MKKIFAFVLAFIMCLSLCACFSEKESGSTVAKCVEMKGVSQNLRLAVENLMRG